MYFIAKSFDGVWDFPVQVFGLRNSDGEADADHMSYRPIHFLSKAKFVFNLSGFWLVTTILQSLGKGAHGMC